MYGVTNFDVDFANQKLNNQRSFLINNTFINSFGEIKNLLSVSMSANFSENYYNEVCNRTNSIHSLSVSQQLIPVFLTITLNGCFRKALQGDFKTFTSKDFKSLPIQQKYKAKRDLPFTINDLACVLNYNFHTFIKRFRTQYKGFHMHYIRVFEPHKKDGVPHIHALLYVPEICVPYLFKIYKDIFYAPQNLKNNSLTVEQCKNGEINGFQTSVYNATGYVMKYITKTFINMKNTYKLDNLNVWYIKHKIRRFLTSRTPIPLWVIEQLTL